MRALLVVDVQEDVMRSRETEGLIEACNTKIAEYLPEQVIYIANRKPWAKRPEKEPLAQDLAVVSENLFYKKQPDAFSNQQIIEYLLEKEVDEVEVIGLDGNWCIKYTALGALRNGLKVSIDTSAIASKNPRSFIKKTVPLLKQAGVKVIGADC